jgi:hypothetical protein
VLAGLTMDEGTLLPMPLESETSQALRLKAPAQAATCWAQTRPGPIELKAHLVLTYLDEVRAPAAVRERWRVLQERGLTWREHYAKDARIEWALAHAPDAVPQPRPAAHGALDLVLHTANPPLAEPVRVRLLHAGEPVPLHPVEFVSGSARAGYWVLTDAQGVASLRLPLGGPWLVRTALLRADPERADAWLSRFATVRFDVQAKDSK